LTPIASGGEFNWRWLIMLLSRKTAFIVTSAIFIVLFCSPLSSEPLQVSGTSAPGCNWGKVAPNPDELNEEEKRVLFEYALSKLLHSEASPSITGGMFKDRSFQIVFISVSDGGNAAEVACGEGSGILEALDSAITNLSLQNVQRNENLWIKIDIVQEVRLIKDGAKNLPAYPTLGLWGLVFPGSKIGSFLPEMVVAREASDEMSRLNANAILETRHPEAEKIARDIFFGKAVDLLVFTTRSLFHDGSRFFDLYRGSNRSGELTESRLLEAARLSAKYLARNVDDQGRFNYIYDPLKDTYPGGYNILRHAGTVYSMLEYCEHAGDPEILKAAERGLSYIESRIERMRKKGAGMAVVVEDNEIKLGGNALAALAIAKHIEVTGDRGHLPLLRELGEWMLAVQDKEGDFLVHKQRYSDGAVSDFRSAYYPGEAILALMRIHRLDPRSKWLDGASRAALYLITVRDKELKEQDLPHDHWLLYGLEELYRPRKDPVFLEHVLRVSAGIIRAQNRTSVFPDWNGGFSNDPRSTPASTRMEGLGAAFRTASGAGMSNEADEILSSLKLGTSFVLNNQIGPSWAMYMKDPKASLGGIRENLTRFDIRIDYVQHALSAFLSTAKILAE
jgi:hypothetical protein